MTTNSLSCITLALLTTHAMSQVITGDFEGDGILEVGGELHANGIDFYFTNSSYSHNEITYVDYYLLDNSDFVLVPRPSPGSWMENEIIAPGDYQIQGDILMQANFYWYDPMDGSGTGYLVTNFPHDLGTMVYTAFTVDDDNTVGYFQYERISDNAYQFHGWALQTDPSLGIEIQDLTTIPTPASASIIAFACAFASRRRR